MVHAMDGTEAFERLDPEDQKKVLGYIRLVIQQELAKEPRLDPDDKRALKHFMTGQIRNVLANEFGVGGKKALRKQVGEAIKAEVDRQVAQYVGDRLVEMITDNLIRDYRGDRGKARGIVEQAVKDAAKTAVGEIVRDAAKQIQVSFNIAAAAKIEQDPDYGRF